MLRGRRDTRGTSEWHGGNCPFHGNSAVPSFHGTGNVPSMGMELGPELGLREHLVGPKLPL